MRQARLELRGGSTPDQLRPPSKLFLSCLFLPMLSNHELIGDHTGED